MIGVRETVPRLCATQQLTSFVPNLVDWDLGFRALGFRV